MIPVSPVTGPVMMNVSLVEKGMYIMIDYALTILIVLTIHLPYLQNWKTVGGLIFEKFPRIHNTQHNCLCFSSILGS